MIITRTPLRISFVGGGSDLRAYYRQSPGGVISTAIDKYVYVIINRRFDGIFRVHYSKTQESQLIDEIEHDIIREALRLTGVREGLEITYLGDLPVGRSGTGLGSSSSLAVGTLLALYAYLGQTVSAERIADEAARIEIDILGRPIGKQDQYAAAYGGLNHIQFQPDERVTVTPLALDQKTLRALDQNLLMFYTGQPAASSEVLDEQQAKTSDNRSFLDEMVKLTHELKIALIKENLSAMGELLHQNWLYKKKLASKISNGELDQHYERALAAGAHGGKILGSGGGGFFLFYCEPERQAHLRASLAQLRELPFRFTAEGSKVVWRD